MGVDQRFLRIGNGRNDGAMRSSKLSVDFARG